MPENELQLRQIDKDELLAFITMASIEAMGSIMSNVESYRMAINERYNIIEARTGKRPLKPDVVADIALDYSTSLAKALLQRAVE